MCVYMHVLQYLRTVSFAVAVTKEQLGAGNGWTMVTLVFWLVLPFTTFCMFTTRVLHGTNGSHIYRQHYANSNTNINIAVLWEHSTFFNQNNYKMTNWSLE